MEVEKETREIVKGDGRHISRGFDIRMRVYDGARHFDFECDELRKENGGRDRVDT